MMRRIMRSGAAAISLIFVLTGAGCSPEREYANSEGSFYSLQAAYESGWLSQDDLKNIAYCYHISQDAEDRTEETFEPSPKVPETLSAETEYKIKRTYLNDVIGMEDGSFEHVFIYGYYGTYDGNVVVAVTDDYHGYDYVIEPQYDVGGVTFYRYVAAYLRVWRADEA